jgi:rhamnulokinase
MATRNVAAVDLGAESGRVMLARFDGRQLNMEEIYRFPNRLVVIRGQRFWNMLSLWQETLTGLRKARQVAGSLDSIGVDSWAVDYGLLDRSGALIGQPFHYRDHRTDGVMEQVFATIPRELLYSRTGIQMLPINTLFQLYAHIQRQAGIFEQAQRLLMIPDLLHSWLCGSETGERTNATTTQCWDAHTDQWASDLLDQLGIPSAPLPTVVDAGTVLGTVLPELRSDLGHVRVIAPATHDTGAAIAATPVAAPYDWAYISSGTWSLVGMELQQPLISAETLAANYTNEGGVFGTTRFLKNVMGLWLLQECLRCWARAGDVWKYTTLLAEVDDVAPFAALIDPDDARFLAPDDMPAAINSYLVEHGQAPLQTPAAFARCIMESLVLRYHEELQHLQQFTGVNIKGIHVLGGGSHNVRMNQWLADASETPVIAGPAEATALGNALMQLVGLSEVSTLGEVRTLAQRVHTQHYPPDSASHVQWHEAAARFASITSAHAK